MSENTLVLPLYSNDSFVEYIKVDHFFPLKDFKIFVPLSSVFIVNIVILIFVLLLMFYFICP